AVIEDAGVDLGTDVDVAREGRVDLGTQASEEGKKIRMVFLYDFDLQGLLFARALEEALQQKQEEQDRGRAQSNLQKRRCQVHPLDWVHDSQVGEVARAGHQAHVKGCE